MQYLQVDDSLIANFETLTPAGFSDLYLDILGSLGIFTLGLHV